MKELEGDRHMKDNIELLLRARDYCDMVIDEIDDLNSKDEAEKVMEVRRTLVSACMAIEEAIELLDAVE